MNVAGQHTHVSDETLDPSVWDSLARQAGESPKAHAAFLDYVRMGPGRSLRKLHERYCRQSDVEPPSDLAPTKRLRTLQEWSVRFAWQKRLAAYKTSVRTTRSAGKRAAEPSASATGTPARSCAI